MSISLGVASFGFFITLVILVVFLVKRDTPTVRVSDIFLSCMHLTTLLLMFAATVFIYYEPRLFIGKCIGMNLNLSVLYALNVAFVYTKSEKLLCAFLSTVRLTAGEIKRTIVTQIFTIVIVLLSINGLLLVLYLQKSPKFEYWLDDDQMHRVHYCNTGSHQSILAGILIIFQMICSMQAFRGRHLPGPMNDAMSMVYAILIACVTFAVSFPINYFRGTQEVEFVNTLVILINATCIVLILYGKKCFIIIFKPHKNTREYFNRQRMLEMSAQSGLRTQ